MTSFDIIQARPSVSVCPVEAKLNVQHHVQQLEIIQTELGPTLTEVFAKLEIKSVPGTRLEVYSEELELEVIQHALTINKFYEGGSLADQDTILGEGVQGDPFRVAEDITTQALNALQIAFRLSEFDTQTAKNEARDNLGLNIIDGGTFS